MRSDLAHRPSARLLTMLVGLCALSALFTCGAARGGAQQYVKSNVLTALVAVPQVALESSRGTHWTLQLDATLSAWRSVRGAPMEFVVLVAEWRHYRRGVFNGPYLGMHAGLTGFRLQKPEYAGERIYQEGFGLVAGASVGYVRRLTDDWRADFFVGGGTAQSKYKGYDMDTGDRYDGEQGWNESGEWVPYRVGVMLARRWR